MDIPISFGLNRKEYKGKFSPINGAGGTTLWDLSIWEYTHGKWGWYHYGELHLRQSGWKFLSHHTRADPFEPLADFFGEVVTAWYQ